MDKRIWDFDPALVLAGEDLIPVAIDNGDGTFTTMKVTCEILRNFILPNSPTPNLGPVLDNTISDPSTLTPNEGDRYIIASGAIGSWIGQENNIAQWSESVQNWEYYIPVANDRTIVTTGVNAGKVYEFDGTSWDEIIVPIIESTPFNLNGTNIDAGGDKTSRIARTGDVVIGTTNSSLSSKLFVQGTTLSSNFATRQGLASTLNNSRTGNFYRLFQVSLTTSTSAQNQTYKIILNSTSRTEYVSNISELYINIMRDGSDVTLNIIIDQKIGITGFELNANNFDFLWNSTTNRLICYYKPEYNNLTMSMSVFGARNSTNYITISNTYLGVSDLSGEVNDSITEKHISYGNSISSPNSRKTIMFDPLSGNSTFYFPNETRHIFGAGYGGGSFNSTMFLNPSLFITEIYDNVNGSSSSIEQTDTSITGSIKGLESKLTQSLNSFILSLDNLASGTKIVELKTTNDGSTLGAELTINQTDTGRLTALSLDPDTNVFGTSLLDYDTNNNIISIIGVDVNNFTSLGFFNNKNGATIQLSVGSSMTTVLDDDNELFTQLEQTVDQISFDFAITGVVTRTFTTGKFGTTINTVSGVGNLTIKNLNIFADNAAAIAGGLVVDQVYKTATGDLKIVY